MITAVGGRPGRRVIRVVFMMVGLCVAGCAEQEGPPRYNLSGAVTFSGKPVVAGEITFAPDSSQANKGPGSYAVIQDGRYETYPGKGIVGGPHLVTIIGYDQPLAGEGSGKETLPLFPPYETTVDLPKQDSTFDFNVPAR